MDPLPDEHNRADAYVTDRLWHRALMTAVRFRAWLLQAGLTSGALAIVTSDDGRLLLVKPHYRAGWGFPGGFLKHHGSPLKRSSASYERRLASISPRPRSH